MKISVEQSEFKKVLVEFFEEKKITPPITSNKLKKAGYNAKEFLLELSKRIGKFGKDPLVKSYLEACEELV